MRLKNHEDIETKHSWLKWPWNILTGLTSVCDHSRCHEQYSSKRQKFFVSDHLWSFSTSILHDEVTSDLWYSPTSRVNILCAASHDTLIFCKQPAAIEHKPPTDPFDPFPCSSPPAGQWPDFSMVGGSLCTLAVLTHIRDWCFALAPQVRLTQGEGLFFQLHDTSISH